MPIPDYRAINALGRRLARTPRTDEDLAALEEYEARFIEPAEEVGAILRRIFGDPARFEGADIDFTSRPLKTLGTILEKLTRERTRLSTMQDIAGWRVVGDLTLSQQDRLVARIAAEFTPPPKISDRRAAPRFGYRAVHVIPEVNGYPIEIQVRTHGQHAWAEAFERAGDIWGRGIRYGEEPLGERRRREVGLQIVPIYMSLSERIASYEQIDEEFTTVSQQIQEAIDLSSIGSPEPTNVQIGDTAHAHVRALMDKLVGIRQAEEELGDLMMADANEILRLLRTLA